MSYATGRCDWCGKPLKTWSWVWRLASEKQGAFCSSRCQAAELRDGDYLREQKAQVEAAADLAYDTLKEMEEDS